MHTLRATYGSPLQGQRRRPHRAVANRPERHFELSQYRGFPARPATKSTIDYIRVATLITDKTISYALKLGRSEVILVAFFMYCQFLSMPRQQSRLWVRELT